MSDTALIYITDKESNPPNAVSTFIFKELCRLATVIHFYRGIR